MLASIHGCTTGWIVYGLLNKVIDFCSPFYMYLLQVASHIFMLIIQIFMVTAQIL